jgi:hypothetical protein
MRGIWTGSVWANDMGQVLAGDHSAGGVPARRTGPDRVWVRVVAWAFENEHPMETLSCERATAEFVKTPSGGRRLPSLVMSEVIFERIAPIVTVHDVDAALTRYRRLGFATTETHRTTVSWFSRSARRGTQTRR